MTGIEDHLQDERRIRLFGPVLLVALGAMALLLVAAVFLIVEFDQTAARREQAMVRDGLQQRIEEYQAVVVPQFDWDAAVANLDNRFDPVWADQNVASYLYNVSGISQSFVIDGQGHPLYASRNGERTAVSAFTPFAAATSGIVPSIRTREAARGGLQHRSGTEGLVARPIQAWTAASIGGRAYLLVATLVQPDFGHALPRGAQAPIAISVVALDTPFLTQLSERYKLTGTSLIGPAVAVPHGMVAVPLRDGAGQAVAHLAWRPQHPGSDLLERLRLPITLILLLFAATAWYIVRSGSRIASDLIASEARARHLAFHDPLTQLPNRAMLFDRLRQLTAEARRQPLAVAVHCIDLDRFKEVNDTLGHDAGDQLIRAVAERLRSLCRQDDLIARLGGDEFVVVQRGGDAAAASHLAHRMLDALVQPYQVEYGRVEVGCSIGVAVIEQAVADPNDMLRWADLALYRSKEAGRMRVTFFEPEMDAALRLRRSLEQDLRRAIGDRSLAMVYQPQVDQHGLVVAVEALLRWTHPVRGVIPPGVFVPLAEESGLILALGEHVLRRVFSEAVAWPHLRTAINVSPVQLRAPGFADLVAKVGAEYRIEPACFEFELTETALLGDDPATAETVEALKRQGFSIALDDFGTGYSSLSVLRRFSVNRIKIDRSFVAALGSAADADGLVDGMIKLARSLDLAVVAEGVETAEQQQRLAASGCQEFQGYLLGKPMPRHELADFVDARARAIPAIG